MKLKIKIKIIFILTKMHASTINSITNKITTTSIINNNYITNTPIRNTLKNKSIYPQASIDRVDS